MPNTALLIVQSVCLTITLMLALILLMARVHVKTYCHSYETARWILFSAMILFAFHYLLQMVYGFRAQGADVGAVINILFYSPVAFLIVYSTVRMGSGKRYLRQYTIIGICSIVLIMGVFMVGYWYYQSLHMPWALYTMMAIHALTRIFFVFHPYGELRRVRRKIEDETSGDIEGYGLYMNTGTTVLYATSLLTVLSVISTRAIVLLGIFVFLALIFYVVSFISMGVNVTTISEVIDDDELIESGSLSNESAHGLSGLEYSDFNQEPLTTVQIQEIESAVKRWRTERGFKIQNLNSSTMAQCIGIPKRILSQYLSQQLNTTFRVWLSNLRIEEAKLLLLEHPDYSNENIAEACGFSSRNYLQNKFKDATNMTPTEWIEEQQNLSAKGNQRPIITQS